LSDILTNSVPVSQLYKYFSIKSTFYFDSPIVLDFFEGSLLDGGNRTIYLEIDDHSLPSYCFFRGVKSAVHPTNPSNQFGGLISNLRFNGYINGPSFGLIERVGGPDVKGTINNIINNISICSNPCEGTHFSDNY